VRHKVYGRHLSRTSNERTQLFRNLVRSLILHESIDTTEAKAKAIKGLVDKLVTQAKSPNTRRLVSQFLVEKQVAERLIKDIAPRLKDRNSGYTSVVRLGKRLGDGTMMVQMSLLVSEKSVELGKTQKESKSEKSEKPATEVKAAESVFVEDKKKTAKKMPAKKAAPVKKKEAKR
jgi:large subunit ribosomal protein L17